MLIKQKSISAKVKFFFGSSYYYVENIYLEKYDKNQNPRIL